MLRLFFFILLSTLMLVPPAFGQHTASTAKARSTTIEGVLVQVSKLPAAEKNSYPDCYYTTTIDIDNIASGESIEKRVVLVLPGFFSRKYAAEAKFKTGDKVRATVVPFASMPDKVRQTQQADEVEDVDLPFYFANDISLIQEFEAPKAPIPFTSRSAKNLEGGAVQHVDMKAKTARREAIRKDLEQINKVLAEHGGDWDKWYDSLKHVREQYKKQHVEKAQRWVSDSFFSAGYRDDGQIYSEDFIKSVVEFKNYLAARNVDLILVRVPNRGEIVEDLFAPIRAEEIMNPYLLRMYKELLDADVEIIADIIPQAKDQRLKFPLMYWYQDFSEDHPAEGISWVIAEEFAKRIGRYDSVNSAPRGQFYLKQAETTSGWLSYKWPAGSAKFNPAEFVRFASVVDSSNKPLRLSQGLESPVLVLGSSYIATPSFYKGASIPHYLAYISGVAPDLVHRNDADFMMPRSIAREGDTFLRNRTVCLFPFVPWTSYRPLASLPLFDPAMSSKTLIASYSGSALAKAISIPAGSRSTSSFSSEGTLNVLPAKTEMATIEVKLPDAVSQFPYFILSLEFSSHDRTTISVKYAGQTDTLKRSETQVKNEELFALVTNTDKRVTIDFKAAKSIAEPTSIKTLAVFGVKEPAYFKAKAANQEK